MARVVRVEVLNHDQGGGEPRRQPPQDLAQRAQAPAEAASATTSNATVAVSDPVGIRTPRGRLSCIVPPAAWTREQSSTVGARGGGPSAVP
jgi:hypothetical protein